MRTKLIAIGNATGVILPKELLDALNLERGQEIELVHENGHVMLAPADAEHAAQMACFEEFAEEYKLALKELAK